MVEAVLPLFFQQIANFCQQHDLRCWSGEGAGDLAVFNLLIPLIAMNSTHAMIRKFSATVEIHPAEHCPLLLRVGV